MKQTSSQKTRDALLNKSAEDLSYILGRYCGPSNIILCEKEFGFLLDKKTIEQMILEKSFEEHLL
jgi:hypothetical protein